MAASGGAAYIMKMYANAQADRHYQMMAAMNATIEARKQTGGVLVRRFIVLVMMSLLAFIVVAPSLIDTQTVMIKEGWLWDSTTEVKGIIYDTTIRSILTSIVGFYFGGSAASR